MPHYRPALLLTALGILLSIGVNAPVSAAADAIHLAIGDGIKSLPGKTQGRFAQIAARQNWRNHWSPADESWKVVGFWEADVSLFDNGSQQLQAAGISAMGRIHKASNGWQRLYIEAGLGLHLLSAKHFGETELSTPFQFSSRVGVGLTFGPDSRHEIGYRLWHLSNAGIKNPNPGLNFHVLYYGVRF